MPYGERETDHIGPGGPLTGPPADVRQPHEATAPEHPHGLLRDAIDGASAGASRLVDALTRPVSLVRVGRKRRFGHDEAALVKSGRVVGCQVYANGRRVSGARGHLDALRVARGHHGAFVWLGLLEPTEAELARVGEVYGFHPLAVEDAVTAHQRPKIETYGGTLVVLLKTAVHVGNGEITADSEVVETGQVVVFVGEEFVVTVRQGGHGGFQELRQDLESRPEMLRRGPAAVLHAVCDKVVDDYLDVVEKIDADVDVVEALVFQRSARPSAERVYQLKREILEFKHAVSPFTVPLRMLADGTEGADSVVPPSVRPYFRDVFDHHVQVVERIGQFDEILTSILQATLTQVTISQNEDMRRISAWVAIAAVPTALAAIYGMNFEHMPELSQPWGYPAVLVVMALACLSLYRAFKRNGWL